MIPRGFSNVVLHYARYNKVPILMSTLKDLVEAESFEANKKFLADNNLAKETAILRDKCSTCSEQGSVKDPARGIVSCSNGHMTQVDPLSLVRLEFNAESLKQLFYSLLSEHIDITPVSSDRSQFTPFGICGFEPIATIQIDEMKLIFLTSFKHLKLKDAATLQGLIANTVYDSFVLFIEGIDPDAENFLSYNTGGAIQFAGLEALTRHDSNIAVIVQRIKDDLNMKTIKLQSYLKNELRNVQSVVTPDMYKSLLEYDAGLASRSFKTATTGSDEEFEDIVARLLVAILPVTQLGHNIIAKTGGKRVDAPDGILEIPHQGKGNLELLFYDCKSVGTESKERKSKRLSQTDEDAFARYCKLFQSDKLHVKLVGGAFIANEFSGQNLANKSLQIRSRDDVPEDAKIIYLPLGSLVKLYTRITTERNRFVQHFESNAVHKLLGEGLDGAEEDKIEKDINFRTFQEIRNSNTNSVLVTEGIVDVFFDHVYSLQSRDSAYLPFVLDISKRMSSRY